MTPVHRPGVLVAAHLAGAQLILTTPTGSIPPPLFLLSTKHRAGYKRIACHNDGVRCGLGPPLITNFVIVPDPFLPTTVRCALYNRYQLIVYPHTPTVTYPLQPVRVTKRQPIHKYLSQCHDHHHTHYVTQLHRHGLWQRQYISNLLQLCIYECQLLRVGNHNSKLLIHW